MIRLLTLNDLPVCQSLSSRYLETQWSLAMYEESLAAGDIGYVYEKSGNVCAYILIRLNPWEIDLLELVVDKECRHQGVGTLLLETVIDLMKAHHIPELFLEVSEANPEALQFYQNHGFESVSYRPGYYDKHGAILMKRGVK